MTIITCLIYTVSNYFLQILGFLTTKLEERTEDRGVSVSVNCVMEVIDDVVRQWPADRLQVYRNPLILFGSNNVN